MTAVEFLIEQIIKYKLVPEGTHPDNVLFNKAKEMEKQQIISSFGVGCQVESTRLIGYQDMAEQYYQETFKKG